jgi:hypothetical protein
VKRCVGCGRIGAWDDGLVCACPACVAEVVRIFGDEKDPLPTEGIEVPEGPATRVADAMLAALGRRN